MFVKPNNRESVPPHPVDGVLAKDGGYWTADQYTFRMLRDGDIVETEAPDAKEKAKAKK
jgi:hypothetical protein